ncbi:hypothetical protein BOTBODRAFT_37572 [Botryobasidium botryosum FD-172 SS1]|uniref:AB hydrolase-1 domain-containing protein n=1 Tax=Botryobasidium botryosum (strain FD-172 SS1) TaxID=930990 RepID=A0A067M048_BOTB1|nr:hypothetical protein BOTBODRAFT_37572 [Botryobasidium botryosum FD-172 SS1]
MDPQEPASFNHRVEKLSTGRSYHFIDQKPGNFCSETPTLFLVHGFPDLWYGWRYQIGPWARKGWRIVAPDMLGYGGTDKPSDTESYSIKRICDDIAALLDLIGVEKVFLIGHDWGALISWRLCLWHPQRVHAVICLSVPFYPPALEYISNADGAKRVPNFGYMVYFEDPRSTKDIESDLSTFFNVLFRTPERAIDFTKLGQIEKLVTGQLKPEHPGNILNTQELQYYLENYKDAMLGPLSYYRNRKIRYEEEKDGKIPNSLPVTLPALFFHPMADGTCQKTHVENSKKFVPSMTVVPLEGSGHWAMVERKEIVTDKVIKWVEERLLEQSPKSKL